MNPIRKLTSVAASRIKNATRILLGSSHYDSAASTPENRNHYRHAGGADRNPANIHTSFTRSTLRKRARTEYDNNCYLRGLIHNYTCDTVGNTYPRLQSLIESSSVLGISESDADTMNSILEDGWAEWAECTAVNWPAKLALLDNEKTLEGESFLPKFNDPEVALKTGVLLNINTLAARRVTDWNYNAGWLQNGTYNDDGIIVDAISGKPVEYYVSSIVDDLLSGNASMNPIRVDASQMYQWFRPTRSDQYRGVSEVQAALPLYGFMRRYTLATVSAAELAACLAGVIETNNPSQEAVEVTARTEFELIRNMLLSLPEGWKANQFKPEQPIQSYEMFINMLLREVGCCLNVPFGLVSGDFSSYNFASGRLDVQGYIERKKSDRLQLCIRVQNPVYEDWMMEYVLRMLDSGDTALVALARKLLLLIQSRKYRYQWRFYNRPSSNPVDDASAAEKNLLNNLTTLSDTFGDKGEDWQDKIKQRARELKYVQEKLGTAEPKPDSTTNMTKPEPTNRLLPSTNGVK